MLRDRHQSRLALALALALAPPYDPSASAGEYPRGSHAAFSAFVWFLRIDRWFGADSFLSVSIGDNRGFSLGAVIDHGAWREEFLEFKADQAFGQAEQGTGTHRMLCHFCSSAAPCSSLDFAVRTGRWSIVSPASSYADSIRSSPALHFKFCFFFFVWVLWMEMNAAWIIPKQSAISLFCKGSKKMVLRFCFVGTLACRYLDDSFTWSLSSVFATETSMRLRTVLIPNHVIQ